MLAVDIDSGNVGLDTLTASIQSVVGDAEALYYSSSSSKPDAQKWRVMIPLASPLDGQDYADTQAAFFGLLRPAGVVADVALARPGQPVYLPNVPPERRDATGTPLFYRWRHTTGPRLRLDERSEIIAARDAQRIADAAARMARGARKPRRGDEPSDRYNETNPIAERLAAYGFVEDARHRGNWKSPRSSSGSFSMRDYGDHWVCVSAWAHGDDAKGWAPCGRKTENGFRAGTAFDLFVCFEHEGNYLAALAAIATDIEQIPDRGEVRDLEEYRQEQQLERAFALRMPGLHLDRSQTGSGKTYATTTAIVNAMASTAVEAMDDETVVPITRVLWSMPDHANGRERLQELRAAGLDAVAYPERTEENCRDMDGVRKVQALGLVAGRTVCVGCPHRRSCDYLREAKAAAAGDMVVVTHERLRISAGQVAGRRDVIVIDEVPESVVNPSITVRVDDLAVVASLAASVRDRGLFVRGRIIEAGSEERRFADAIVRAHDAITLAAIEATEPGAVEMELPPADEVPEGWQRLIVRWVDNGGVGPRDTDEDRARFRDSLRLLTGIVAGSVERLHLSIDQTHRHKKQPDGSVVESDHLHHFVIGSWRTRLPNVPTLLLDATARAADIEAAAGRPVRDITPTGHLPAVVPVTQLPHDVTAGASTLTAIGWVVAIMDAHPEIERWGLMGHTRHIREMMKGKLPERYRERVAKHCYFGQGPDRGSNDWHHVCDGVMVVGTMRPGGGPVRERLIRHGNLEAARRDGEWGVRHWSGVTVDGRTATFSGLGYRDPDWHNAHTAIARASGLQAIGRGRSVSESGRPVWIVSSEPMGCPVDDRTRPTTTTVWETAGVVQAAAGGGEVRYGDAVVALEAAFGITRRPAEERMARAAEAGAIVSPRRGWWAVGITAVSPIQKPYRENSGDRPVTHPAVSPGVPVPDLPPDDTLERLAERAAIMEADGGLAPDEADHRAIGEVLGRPEAATPPRRDHLASVPAAGSLVDHASRLFGGIFRVLDPADDPFPKPHRPGRCRCGSGETVVVPIHDGDSERIDCAGCGRFIEFARWHDPPPKRSRGLEFVPAVPMVGANVAIAAFATATGAWWGGG